MSQDSDTESVDSQATVVIEDDTFNPIRLINCATLIESERGINRRMGIFQYEGKGITAFYQSSGTSGAPALNGTYVPFYGETNKLLKAIDVFPNTQNNPWKIALRNENKIMIDHTVLNYFQHFYELQISASIDSSFWNRLSYRDFVLSHEWNETTNELNEKTGDFVPLSDPIPYSGNFSQMDCARHIEMEKGEINKFLRTWGARLGEGRIEAYQLQQQQQESEAARLAEMYELYKDQLEEEGIKEPPGGLKLDKGGKSLKKRKKTKKLYKRSNKRKKTKLTLKTTLR
jgi:hypothetical protein